MVNSALKSELAKKAEIIIDLSVAKRIEQDTLPIPTVELPNEAEIRAEHERFGIPALFEPFSSRDPAVFSGMIADLESVVANLTADISVEIETGDDQAPAASMMESVKSHIETYWDGQGATNFADKFLSPFEERLSRQCELAYELQIALMASKEILEASQKDIMMIADRAIVSLGGDAPEGTDIELASADLNILSVVGALAGVIAAIPTTPVVGLTAAASVGLSLVSASVDLSEAAGDIEMAEVGSGPDSGVLREGADATLILQSVVTAIYTLQNAIEEEERSLMAALRADADILGANTYDLLISPPPMIIDNPTADFFDEDGPSGPS